MFKLDKEKNKKVCAILIASTLAFSVIGCSSQSKIEQTSERFSYNIENDKFYITDNRTDIKIILSDEIEEMIKNGEENVTISFNDNDIDIDKLEITKIREALDNFDRNEKRNSIIGFSSLALITIMLGALLRNMQKEEDRCLYYKIMQMSSEEFDKLCEKNKNSKRYIKKIQDIRKNKYQFPR